MIRRSLALLPLLLVMGACGAAGSTEPAGTASASPSAAASTDATPTEPSTPATDPTTPSESATGGAVDPTTPPKSLDPKATMGNKEAITSADDAKADLAKRLSVAASTIKHVSTKDVEWSDASVGCPEPGKMYAQMITPGQQMILEHDGKQFHYHAAGRGTFGYCANPEKPVNTES